ncbi:MAG: ABC transporter permease subunit [Oscillospiraceae bacterium]|nr:ABC transporter permease subunit [Oscillospiraceae bacterium]
MSYLIPRKTKEKRHTQAGLYVTITLLAMLFLTALLAPILAPNDPYQTNITNQLAGPSSQYPLGTDQLGRCILSRILYGAETSLFSSVIIVAAVFCIGTALGILSGYFGGVLDQIVSRITTIFQAFPRMILAIAVAGVLGIGIRNTILALCAVYWTEYARLSRSLVMQLKSRTFLKAARVCGESHLGIMVRHILPNIFPSMIVTACLDMGVMIMEISALSFLGMGVETPMAEWGEMMSAGRAYLQTNPWLIIIPGIAIFISVMIFNLFGEKLRDRLDLR